MRRSRKMRGGDSTISVSTDAVSKLAADANQLAEDLGKLVPSAPAEPAVQSDLSATPNVPAAVVHQPSNVQPGDDASEPVVKSPGPGDNAVSNVQTDAVAPGPGDVASNVQNDAAVPGDNAGSNVQNDAAAGTPSVLGSGSAAADQPSNAAAAPSVLDGLSIPYGSGLSVPYANIARMIQNMITNPTYNKKQISNDTLQSLLTKIKLATTPLEVTNLLNGAGFGKIVGTKANARYFSGGTKKRKRTKMTKRRKTRKTRKMKKTRKMRKMRKMRKTMKI